VSWDEVENGVEVSSEGDGVHFTEEKTIEILRSYLAERGISVGEDPSLTGVKVLGGQRMPMQANGGVTVQWDEKES
jgi:hypothetical protein